MRRLLAAACILATTLGVAGSVRAGEVRLYSMLDKVVQDEVTKYLTRELWPAKRISVQSLTMSTGELWARIQAERPLVNADVVIHVPFGIVGGIKQGLWMPYKAAPGWADVTAKYKDPDGWAYTLGSFSYVFIGHRPGLAQRGWKMPATYPELADPKWKGQLLLPSPVTAGTGTMMLYSIMGLFNMNEAAGWTYLESLHRNVAQYTRSGNTPVDLVGRGEYLIALAADENVPVRIREGYPLEWVVPREGIGTTPVMVAISRTAKNLDDARQVVDFMGSEKFMRFFAGFGYLVAREEIPAVLYGQRPKTIDVDVAYQAGSRDRLLQEWKTRFSPR